MRFPKTLTRTARATWLAAALSLAVTGCDVFDRLLAVKTPSRLAESAYLVPANALLISNSAIADFECAHGGYIVASGLAAGEFVDGTQTASRWDFDRRSVTANQAHYATFGCAAIGVYTPLNTARYTNDQAVEMLEGWTDVQVANRNLLIARNAAFAGWSLVLLGEGFCACVIDVGPSLTPAQVFDSAEVRFDKAITAAQAAGDVTVERLARVGRARARLNGGDLAGAAADAALVPDGFVFNGTADANAGSRNNRIYAQNNQGFSVTVAPAYRGLTVNGSPDPRVNVTQVAGLTSDQLSQRWVQNKYTSLTAQWPIASWIEARLIQAEAGGAGTGEAIINNLRARPGVALPALTPAEVTAWTATVAEERRRELFVQGTRWWDINRLNLTQVPATGAAFAKGGFYGDQRCWPLPDVETLANPNFP